MVLGIFFGDNTSSINNKNKSNEEELLKLKNFFPAKEEFNKMKSQHAEWEKIFANYMSFKELISKIHKQFLILTGQYKKTKVKSLSHVRLFATPWTVTH